MLIQQKTQQLSVIEVNNFYVYEYIDPPEVMERKHEPSRAIICILGALLGATLGVLIVFTRFYIFEVKGTKN
jgi:LPS O-antigen subunit length determinant protein (WzzB/FepE family)